MTAVEQQSSLVDISIPWLFARGHAKKLRKALIEKSDQLDRIMGMSQQLVAEVKTLRAQQKIAFQQLEELGALSVTQLEIKRHTLESEIAHRLNEFELEKADAAEALDDLKRKVKEAHHSLVSTDDLALLQDVGVYQYRHPLSDAVAYQSILEKIDDQIKQMLELSSCPINLPAIFLTWGQIGIYSRSLFPSALMTRRDEPRSRHPIVSGRWPSGAPGGAASARWASQPHRLRDARASRDGLAIRSRQGTRTNLSPRFVTRGLANPWRHASRGLPDLRLFNADLG